MDTVESVDDDLAWALSAVTRSYMRAAENAVAGVPGGPRGYLVLATAGRGEPSSQLALAQHLGVDRTVMTYLLDDLEQAGLVERRPDPADRRARRVAITESGRDLLCGLKRRLREAEDDLLQPLDEQERVVLRSLLHRLATTLAPGDPCQLMQAIVTHDIGKLPGRRRRRQRS
jgi:DNA-binding MarR family transcriptional regulator